MGTWASRVRLTSAKATRSLQASARARVQAPTARHGRFRGLGSRVKGVLLGYRRVR